MSRPKHLFVSECDGALHDTRAANWAAHPLRANFSRHHLKIRTAADLKACLRAGPYAWPGGYQLWFIMADGEALSFEAARENLHELISAIRSNHRHDGWRPIAIEGEHMGDFPDGVTCAHSGAEIVAPQSEDA